MKIRCAHCRELFTLSPSQLKGLGPVGSHYCSHACKCEDQKCQPAPRPLVPEDLHTGGREVHLRVAGNRELRRLARALAGLDGVELVRIRPTMNGRTWSLRPQEILPGSGSPTARIAEVTKERRKNAHAPAQ